MHTHYLRILFFLSPLISTAQTGNQFSADSVPPKPASRQVWLRAGAGLVYAGAVYGVYRCGDAGIQHESQETNSGFRNSFVATGSYMGLGKTQMAAMSATAIASFIIKDKRLQKTAVIWAGALAINSIVTDKFKTGFQRYRPNTGKPYNTFDGKDGTGKNLSFVSGHTSNIFATATVLATQYRHKKWVAPVAYGIAGLVGASRVAGNYHWASDVMAGAAVGYVSAKLMCRTYEWAQYRIQFLPQVSRYSQGVQAIVHF